jgi:hypothetical protein
MKAIQWSCAEINPMTEVPATHPDTVIPVWKPPKQRSMMRGARESPDVVVLPTTSETAKQPIGNPIPIRTAVDEIHMSRYRE